jgi:hypothetical protein
VTATLSLPSDYLERLIVRARGLQAREPEVDPIPGSNPTDDHMRDAVQDTQGDLSREELREELQGLTDRGRAELVALLWVGRGDEEPEDWDAIVEVARGRVETPTPTYLLSEPLVGEYWSEGAEKIGLNLFQG